MTAFEFTFPLFGLLVGLSYAEMLGGLARAMKSSKHARIGWLVPALGLLVLINLTMFWYGSWQLRDAAAPTIVGLLLILLLGGLYFLAASLVFPNPGEEGTDLDDHFMANRRDALFLITLCNLIGLGQVASHADWSMRPIWWIANSLFLALLLAAALVPSKRLAGGALVLMIALHGLGIALAL